MKGTAIWICLVINLATASDIRAKGLKVTLADGRVVEVPKSGPLHDAEAVALAKEIRRSDKDIARLKKSMEALVSRGQVGPEVAEATVDTAVELRDLSAQQLDLALRKAQNTSGFLDRSLIQSGQSYLNTAREVAAAPAKKLTVPTEITTDPPDGVLHRMLVADYERKSHQWQSYSPGQLLRIGNYMFRVSSRSEDGSLREYYEVVTVLADPTTQTIRVP